MTHRIRKMQSCDIEQATEIEREAFPSMEPATNFKHELRNGIAHYIVAFEDKPEGQHIIGLAGFWLLTAEAHIVNIAVRRSCRRQGIGENLLINLFNLALEKGATIITLEVRASDDTARNLYIKYGFKKEGVRRGYYLDNREDAVIMTIRNMKSVEFETRLQRLKKSHSTRWGRC